MSAAKPPGHLSQVNRNPPWSIFGDVKSCDDDDMDYESGIECDDDIPTVEPPVDNPALFLMPDRTSKELPPLNRLPSGQPLSQHPMFVSTIATRKNQLPSLASSGTLPPLLQDIYQTEAQLNSSQSSDIPGCHTGLIIEEEDETLGLVPEINDGSSPCLSDYNSCTDLTSSGGLPSAYNQMFPEVKVEPTRRVSLLAREKLRRESPDPHVPSNIG